MLSFKGKKAIIFDLDGTIANLAVNWDQLKRILSARYTKISGIKREFDSVSACLDRIVEWKDEGELRNFFKIIEKQETGNIKKTKYIEETVFFINNLGLFGVEKGTKLAIMSLNTRKTIIESLKLANIRDKFDFIVGREDVRKWKPNPDGLLKIKEYFNLKSKEIIYFGDLKKDLETGENAGIESYLIDVLIALVNT
ncbi:MAG: HAD family hydrolase [Promethearchaeota archaeon]